MIHHCELIPVTEMLNKPDISLDNELNMDKSVYSSEEFLTVAFTCFSKDNIDPWWRDAACRSYAIYVKAKFKGQCDGDGELKENCPFSDR